MPLRPLLLPMLFTFEAAAEAAAAVEAAAGANGTKPSASSTPTRSAQHWTHELSKKKRGWPCRSSHGLGGCSGLSIKKTQLVVKADGMLSNSAILVL